MSEDQKQTAILENVLGEVRKLNSNVTRSEEGQTTGLALEVLKFLMTFRI